MNALDILLRLLPFSTSHQGHTQFFSNLGFGDWIITIAFFVLWGVFLYQIFISRREYQEKINKIHNFDGRDGELLDAPLKTAYHHFQKHLIKDEQGRLHRIYDASQFFHLSTVFDVIGKPKFSHTASLLLSLGLLGTFIGLFYGLVQLNLDDAETLKQSMSQLIHASGAKFASSIWGLFLSILFGIYEKWLGNKAITAITHLQDQLNELYPLVISEQSLLDGLSQNEKFFGNNIDLLSRISQTTISHADVSSEILRDNQDLLRQMVELLSQRSQADDEFQSSVVQSSEESLKINQDIVEKLDDILQMNEQQVDQLNGLAWDMADKMSGMLQEKLSQVVYEAMHKSMQTLVDNIGGTKENTLYHAIKEMVNGTSADFADKLSKVLNDFVVEMKKSTGADAEQVNKVIGNISSITGTLNGDVSNLTTQMTTLLNAIGARIDAQEVQNRQVSQAIEEGAKNAGRQITGALSPISTTLEGFNDLMLEAKDYLQVLPANLEQIASATNNLKISSENTLNASGRLEGSFAKLENTSTQLTKIVNGFNEGVDGIAAGLQVIPKELTNVLDAIKQASSDAGSAYSSLANQHRELLSNNQRLMEDWMKGLDGYQASTRTFTDKTLDGMKTHIESVLEEAKKGLIEYQNASDKYTQGNLKKYDESVESFIQKADLIIQTTFARFDGSLATFANELTAAIGELNDAIDILSQKTRGR